MNAAFFTDRDLGKIFPTLLHEAGLAVIPYHRVYDREDVADAEWLSRCGEEGWIALTHDKNIAIERRWRIQLRSAAPDLSRFLSSLLVEDLIRCSKT